MDSRIARTIAVLDGADATNPVAVKLRVSEALAILRGNLDQSATPPATPATTGSAPLVEHFRTVARALAGCADVRAPEVRAAIDALAAIEAATPGSAPAAVRGRIAAILPSRLEVEQIHREHDGPTILIAYDAPVGFRHGEVVDVVRPAGKESK